MRARCIAGAPCPCTVTAMSRLPDVHLGYLLNTQWLTMGMLLSVPMLLLGLIILKIAYKREA